jgi:hypothetical protein
MRCRRSGRPAPRAIVEARAKAKLKNWDDFVARKVVPVDAAAAIDKRGMAIASLHTDGLRTALFRGLFTTGGSGSRNAAS